MRIFIFRFLFFLFIHNIHFQVCAQYSKQKQEKDINAYDYSEPLTTSDEIAVIVVLYGLLVGLSTLVLASMWRRFLISNEDKEARNLAIIVFLSSPLLAALIIFIWHGQYKYVFLITAVHIIVVIYLGVKQVLTGGGTEYYLIKNKIYKLFVSHSKVSLLYETLDIEEKIKKLKEGDPHFSELAFSLFDKSLIEKAYKNYPKNSHINYNPFLSRFASKSLTNPYNEIMVWDVTINNLNFEYDEQIETTVYYWGIKGYNKLTKSRNFDNFLVAEKLVFARKSGIKSLFPELMSTLCCPNCLAKASFSLNGVCSQCNKTIIRGENQWYLKTRKVITTRKKQYSLPENWREDRLQIKPISEKKLQEQIEMFNLAYSAESKNKSDFPNINPDIENLNNTTSKISKNSKDHLPWPVFNEMFTTEVTRQYLEIYKWFEEKNEVKLQALCNDKYKLYQLFHTMKYENLLVEIDSVKPKIHALEVNINCIIIQTGIYIQPKLADKKNIIKPSKENIVEFYTYLIKDDAFNRANWELIDMV